MSTKASNQPEVTLGKLSVKYETCLKFLESGRDGTGAVGDGVALARDVLALDVGDVHEQLLARILQEEEGK